MRLELIGEEDISSFELSLFEKNNIPNNIKNINSLENEKIAIEIYNIPSFWQKVKKFLVKKELWKLVSYFEKSLKISLEPVSSKYFPVCGMKRTRRMREAAKLIVR